MSEFAQLITPTIHSNYTPEQLFTIFSKENQTDKAWTQRVGSTLHTSITDYSDKHFEGSVVNATRAILSHFFTGFLVPQTTISNESQEPLSVQERYELSQLRLSAKNGDFEKDSTKITELEYENEQLKKELKKFEQELQELKDKVQPEEARTNEKQQIFNLLDANQIDFLKRNFDTEYPSYIDLVDEFIKLDMNLKSEQPSNSSEIIDEFGFIPSVGELYEKYSDLKAQAPESDTNQPITLDDLTDEQIEFIEGTWEDTPTISDIIELCREYESLSERHEKYDDDLQELKNNNNGVFITLEQKSKIDAHVERLTKDNALLKEQNLQLSQQNQDKSVYVKFAQVLDITGAKIEQITRKNSIVVITKESFLKSIETLMLNEINDSKREG